MARILVAEDEPDIALGLKDDLTRQGYEVETVGDGAAAIRRATEEKWDLILLDVMMPRVDGFEVCQELRRHRIRTPIIILTAKVHEAEKVLGLELGADDYVTKPFSPRELRARIKAILRRSADDSPLSFSFADVEVDFEKAELRRSGVPVELTALELRLLRAFVTRPGRVLTRTQLIDAAWEQGTFVTARVVDTHVMNLRRKIESDPRNPRFIRGVRGIGYRFEM